MPKNKGNFKLLTLSLSSRSMEGNRIILFDLQEREEKIAGEASAFRQYPCTLVNCFVYSVVRIRAQLLFCFSSDLSPWPEGKNEGEEKRELIFKEDGQRKNLLPSQCQASRVISLQNRFRGWVCPSWIIQIRLHHNLLCWTEESNSCAEYAQVLRMLGNGRLDAMCIDGVKRLCHIRGKMRKKVWVNTVSLRRDWERWGRAVGGGEG